MNDKIQLSRTRRHRFVFCRLLLLRKSLTNEIVSARVSMATGHFSRVSQIRRTAFTNVTGVQRTLQPYIFRYRYKLSSTEFFVCTRVRVLIFFTIWNRGFCTRCFDIGVWEFWGVIGGRYRFGAPDTGTEDVGSGGQMRGPSELNIVGIVANILPAMTKVVFQSIEFRHWSGVVSFLGSNLYGANDSIVTRHHVHYSC